MDMEIDGEENKKCLQNINENGIKKCWTDLINNYDYQKMKKSDWKIDLSLSLHLLLIE
jgi:hypothetical protein